jgi:cytochrome b561
MREIMVLRVMTLIIQHVKNPAYPEGMMEKASSRTGWLFIYTFTKLIPTGISSHILPSSVRAALFFCKPPHFLKKNGKFALNL